MRLTRLFAPFLLVAALAACETNPYTGRSQLLLVNDDSLTSSAVAAWSDLKAKTPVSTNPAYNRRVQTIMNRLIPASGVQANWEFTVFDTNEKNAFVLPGGKVGVYRGIMDLCKTDDELAAVLGHELAHVALHHAAERASQSQLANVGVALAGTRVSGGTLQALGLGLQYGVLLPYSRTQESEADRVGVDFMHAAGYRAQAAVTLWERMAAEGGSRPPELMSTHPDPANRMQTLRAYIAQRGY